MARIRSIHPSFKGDSKVARLSRDARLTFLLMLPEADDEGRLFGSPKWLAGTLYPNDDDVSPRLAVRWVQEIIDQGMVCSYEVDGVAYLAILKFGVYQKPKNPSPSKLPAPPEGLPTTEAATTPTVPQSLLQELPPNGLAATPLDIGDRKEEGVGKEGEGERSVADGLLREWYEQRNPRPVLAKNAWPGMRRVVQKALDAGHPPELVRKALSTTDVVSHGWLETGLRRAQKQNHEARVEYR